MGNISVHLLTSDIPELCRRKEFSHLGQTPVLHVKCLHPITDQVRLWQTCHSTYC